MSGTVIAIVAGAVVGAVAALVMGTRWVSPDGNIRPRRLGAVSVVAGVPLTTASVAGMIGGSPWFILYIVIGIPLLALMTYRQNRRGNP